MDKARYLLHRLAQRLSQSSYVRKAVDENADLSAFKEKPSARIIIGICLMALSYVLGWPAVAFLGVVALLMKEPLVAVIGGPLVYGFSHLVFLAGFYLTGAYYTAVFMRWATRKGVELLLKISGEKTAPEVNMNS